MKARDRIIKSIFLFIFGVIFGILIVSVDIVQGARTIKNKLFNPKTSEILDTEAIHAKMQQELEYQWHQPMMEGMDLADSNLSLNDLYKQRAQIAYQEELDYFSAQMDYESCDQEGQIDIDAQSLESFEETIQPYKDEFISQYFAGLPEPLDQVNTIFREFVLETDDYTLEYVVFPSRLVHINVYAYLLTPKQASPSPDGYPAVIVAHANGDNIEAMVGINSMARNRTNNAALKYVQEGAVVLVPYLIERSPTRSEAMSLSLGFDKNPYLHLVQRLISSVDWLYAQEDYPISRIGLHGLSYGGILSLWSAILDDRIDTIAISNSIRDYSYWLYGDEDDRSIYFNNIFFFIDYCRWEVDKQLMFLIPRHVYIESSTLDKSLSGRFSRDEEEYSNVPLDMSSITIITDKVQSLYDQFGLADSFNAETFDGGHVMNVEHAVPWVMKQLTRS